MTIHTINAPCSFCLPWCARSRAMLETRKRNLAAAPDVQVHPCPQCGSTEWATSTILIGDDPPPRRWWEFWK